MLNKGATHLMADDSRTGGRCYRTYSPTYSQLLVTVMTSHINLPSIDHSEMASDNRRFASGIFAILAKALIDANKKLDFDFTHSVSVSKLRARSGFSRLHRPFSQKKQDLNILNSRPVKISIGACLSYVLQNPLQMYKEKLK